MRSLMLLLWIALLVLAPGAGRADVIALDDDPHGAAEPDPRAEDGRRLLARHGCTGCHSLDGSAGPAESVNEFETLFSRNY